MVSWIQKVLRHFITPTDKEHEDVRKFHMKFGLLAYYTPGHLTHRKLQERVDCMQEELNEFCDACATQDLAAQADALIDLVYFAKGTSVMLGLPWAELWDDVQRANMSKVRGSKIRNGHLHKVDMVKPPDWQGPKTQLILRGAGYHERLRRRIYHRDDAREDL